MSSVFLTTPFPNYPCDPKCLLQGPETSKVPKVVRRGCKRCFGPRGQRSPKSLLHHLNPVLHRCNSLLHQCKRTLLPRSKRPFAPSPIPTLGTFEVSGRVLFPFCPLCWPPLFLPFSGHLFALFFPLKKLMLCSVEREAQHKAWRGAVSGWKSPQSSGRKFLPEICVKKGQNLLGVQSAAFFC